MILFLKLLVTKCPSKKNKFGGRLRAVGVTANKYGVSFGGDESVLKLR